MIECICVSFILKYFSQPIKRAVLCAAEIFYLLTFQAYMSQICFPIICMCLPLCDVWCISNIYIYRYFIHIPLYTQKHFSIHIYSDSEIYIEREREREKEICFLHSIQYIPEYMSLSSL